MERSLQFAARPLRQQLTWQHLRAMQAVVDAELDGNETLVGLTASHTAQYAAGLIRQLAEQHGLPSKVRFSTNKAHFVCNLSNNFQHCWVSELCVRWCGICFLNRSLTL